MQELSGRFIGFWMSYRGRCISWDTLVWGWQSYVFCGLGVVLSPARIDVQGMDEMTSLILFSTRFLHFQSCLENSTASVSSCVYLQQAARGRTHSVFQWTLSLGQNIHQRRQINQTTSAINPGLWTFHLPQWRLVSIGTRGSTHTPMHYQVKSLWNTFTNKLFRKVCISANMCI